MLTFKPALTNVHAGSQTPVRARTRAQAVPASVSSDDGGALSIKAAALGFVTLACALFWMAVIAAACYAAGYTISPGALSGIGAAIALFLTIVCAPFMLRQ